MKLAIMQPYFLPYIGYFQLMHAVDEFVVYGELQFTTSGWVRRNRILLNGTDFMFSLPLKNALLESYISERQLALSFPDERNKILRRIETAYHKAPYFQSAMPVVEQCFGCEDRNLFGFIFHSLLVVCHYLNIETKLTISSDVPGNHALKGQQRIIAVSRALSADHYINAIGGMKLYSKEELAKEGIKLSFIQSEPIEYKQFRNSFVPNLSIIDVMMFNSVEKIHEFLGMYQLV